MSVRSHENLLSHTVNIIRSYEGKSPHTSDAYNLSRMTALVFGITRISYKSSIYTRLALQNVASLMSECVQVMK